MQFEYKGFHIDATPLDEGGHFYGRAKIYRPAASGATAVEVKYSGDLGDFPSEEAAFDSAKRWAIQWCDEQGT
ncbi:hypothetical protein [Burkholderia sp. PU8-34]